MFKNAAVGHKSNFVTKNAISECTGINGSILPSEQSGLYCETMFAAAVDRYWDGWTKTALRASSFGRTSKSCKLIKCLKS